MSGHRRTALLAVILSSPNFASAYCRSTTCDPKDSCDDKPDRCCVLDAEGCDTNGLPLAWPNTCVSFNVAETGSSVRSIDAGTFAKMVDSAVTRWIAADCEEGRSPSIQVEARGPIECGVAEYSKDAGNANLWLFRDDAWPYGAPGSDAGFFGAALALTTLNYNWKTGEIYDADVELNSNEVEFTIGDEAVRVDLESILTHEAGHFLGLDHSSQPGATMASGYFPGTTEPRTLDEDDVAGICASYPARRSAAKDTCEPNGGYAEVCAPPPGGCGLAGALPGHQGPSGASPLGLFVTGVTLLARRVSLRKEIVS